MAYPNAEYTSAVSRHYRRLGWETYLVSSGVEVRRLARSLLPAVVVLGTELPNESGWLTCDKLTHELPDLKVILVADPSAPATPQFAAFVGAAALVREADGVQALAAEIEEALAVTVLA
jgi:DNA-binding NarL/FixJ family response regulator